jgi:pyruvate/2-oxoglutarate dehydrogenase complex dihydrolipoamide acyltransferase (E2) component
MRRGVEVAAKILVPKMGIGMVEGALVEWKVEDGARVSAGDIIYQLEADKSLVDVEAPASGVIRLHGEPGQTYAVGTLIAEIE